MDHFSPQSQDVTVVQMMMKIVMMMMMAVFVAESWSITHYATQYRHDNEVYRRKGMHLAVCALRTSKIKILRTIVLDSQQSSCSESQVLGLQVCASTAKLDNGSWLQTVDLISQQTQLTWALISDPQKPWDMDTACFKPRVLRSIVTCIGDWVTGPLFRPFLWTKCYFIWDRMVLKGFKNSPISMSFLNTEVKLCANIQGFFFFLKKVLSKEESFADRFSLFSHKVHLYFEMI